MAQGWFSDWASLGICILCPFHPTRLRSWPFMFVLAAHGAQKASAQLGVASVFSVGEKWQGGTSKLFPASMNLLPVNKKIPTAHLQTFSYAPLVRTVSR